MRAQAVLQFSLSVLLTGAMALPAVAQSSSSSTNANSPTGSSADAPGGEAAQDAPEGDAKAPDEAESTKKPGKPSKAKVEKVKDKAESVEGNPALVGLASSNEAGEAFPLHIQASLTNQIGQGTFVVGPTHNSSVVSSLSVAPRFQYGPFNLMIRQNFIFEWTSPDNQTGRRMDWFDTSVDANYIIPVGATGLLVGLRGGLRLPISLISRQQGRLFAATARLNLIYSTPIPGLVVIGGFGGQGNVNVPAWRGAGFFGNAAEGGKPFIDSQGREISTHTCLARSGELAANACANTGSIGNISGVGIASYSIGQFNFSAVLSAFTIIREYWGPDDEFTSENAVPGLSHTPLTNGDLSVNWTPLRWFTLSGGLTSFQPMFDSANRWPRFPFWDFIAARDNYSSVYVSTTFNY